jgi:acetyltransferase
MCRLLAGAKRKIYPVNLTASEVLGIKAYDSVVNIPGSIDLAVIAVSARQVPAVISECVGKGVKAAVIVSGGFAETGKQGGKLEADVVKVARQAGMRFVGPNSMGHADTSSQLSTLRVATWNTA